MATVWEHEAVVQEAVYRYLEEKMGGPFLSVKNNLSDCEFYYKKSIVEKGNPSHLFGTEEFRLQMRCVVDGTSTSHLGLTAPFTLFARFVSDVDATWNEVEFNSSKYSNLLWLHSKKGRT